MGGSSSSAKAFRKKMKQEGLVNMPLNPLMPSGYNARQRAELKEWEAKIMASKSDDKDIEK